MVQDFLVMLGKVHTGHKGTPSSSLFSPSRGWSSILQLQRVDVEKWGCRAVELWVAGEPSGDMGTLTVSAGSTSVSLDVEESPEGFRRCCEVLWVGLIAFFSFIWKNTFDQPPHIRFGDCSDAFPQSFIFILILHTLCWSCLWTSHLSLSWLLIDQFTSFLKCSTETILFQIRLSFLYFTACISSS